MPNVGNIAPDDKGKVRDVAGTYISGAATARGNLGGKTGATKGVGSKPSGKGNIN